LKQIGGKEYMERKKQIDSIEVTVGRIDERVSNIIKTTEQNRIDNMQEHKDIMAAQEKLCIHVNHENELLSARIEKGENDAGILKNAVDSIVKAIDKLTIISEASVKRLDTIELDRTKTKAERSGQIKIYKWVVGILSFALLLLGVAAAIHII
jgi:hypothetical protein